MHCKEAYLFICDNLDQPIDSPECQEIRRHIAECPDCQSYLDSLKKTVTLYQTVPNPQRVPQGVHERLMRMIRANTKPASKLKGAGGRSARH